MVEANFSGSVRLSAPVVLYTVADDIFKYACILYWHRLRLVKC